MGPAPAALETRARPAQLGIEQGDPAATDSSAQGSGGGLSNYLHALRRRWPVALSLGLLAAAVAVPAVWFSATSQYTAVSLLQISANEQKFVFDTADQTARSSFEIYKGTQQQLLSSDVVLIAALRKPDVAGFESVKREDDPVRWLAKSLRAEFPGNAEILKVSLSGKNPDEVAGLVSAVVDAYMSEVVDVERNGRKKRLDDLDRLYTEKETEMRTKRTDLKQLAEQLGTGDTGALALKQQIALQQYAEARTESVRLRTELQRASSELKMKQAQLKAMTDKATVTGDQAAATKAPGEKAAGEKSVPEQVAGEKDAGQKVAGEKGAETTTAGRAISADEVDTVAAIDPMAIKLQGELDELTHRLIDIQSRAKGKLAESSAADYLRARKATEEKLAARRQELAARLTKTTYRNLAAELAQLQTRVAVLSEQEQQAVKDLDGQRKQAERFGNSSIDVEMMRAELQYLEKVLTPIADERAKLKVELRSTPRITLFQRAQAPSKADHSSQVQSTAFAGLLGFFAPGCLVLWWDVRKRRINSLGDVSHGLGLTVVGTLPQLPAQIRGRAATGTKRHRRWQMCMDHAVDGIAARLFLRKTSGGARVVLVSSATRGEGKTTLATQLATRLARTGERTLLVDFDLRRPALHQVFGMQLGPGLSDVLRHDSSLAQVVRPTDTENLFIMTAGGPLPDSLGTLANGSTGALFGEARAEYAFVVIDGSPILPVVDALLAAQHADAVVLSVRRDVSQAPKVLAACERLGSFGVQRFVAVLTGSDEEIFYDDQDHVLQTRVEEAPGA